MRRTAAITALSLVLVSAAIGLPVAGIFLHRAAERDLTEARLARSDLDHTFVAALNAQAAASGYVITGDPAFLESHTAAVEGVESGMAELRQDLDEPGAPAQAAAFEAAFRAWLAEAARPQVDLVREGNASAARAMTPRSSELFDEVSRSHATLEGTLAAAEADARDGLNSARSTTAALVVAGLLAAAGVGSTVVYLLRRFRHYEHELERTRRDLSLAEHLSVTRGEMLSAASHELRNPLTGLLLSAELLAEEARTIDGNGLAELADDVTVAARRTGQMVSELLDFTRFEAGQLQIAHDAVAPRELVEEALEDIRLGSPRASFEVDIAIPPELRIDGDALRLRAALRNLLENALRYGRPPYRVRLGEDGDEVRIHVEDGGPGVPPAERGAIFDRFRRGSTAEGTAGTGIGLFLAQGIVELHGGHLEVGESELGGADFVVALPARQPAAT